MTPLQVSLSPGSTKMVSELGEDLGILDPIYHLVTELLSPQAPILNAGPITIWGNAGFLDIPLPSLRAVMRQQG